MLKRILAGLATSALVAVVAGTAPQPTQAAASPTQTYDYVVSLTGAADDTLPSSQQSCRTPYSNRLQDALDDYTNGDSIFLCPGVYLGHFGQDDDASLTLVGADPATTIIDGRNGADGDVALWLSTDGGYLTVKNLTFRNGYSSDAWGAAITTNGAFNCVNSRFLNNHQVDGNGGAVFAGQVSLDRCTFTGNEAEDYGGAVYAYDGVNCKNSTFTNNIADENDGNQGDGGALYVEEYLESHRCTFKGNYAFRGGAVSAYYLTDYDGIYTSNSAEDLAGAIQSRSGNDAFLYRSKFTSNYTVTDALGEYWSGNGGAVSAWGYLYVYGAKFVSNYAAAQGGAIFADYFVETYRSTYDRNESYIDGGAIASYDDEVRVYDGNIFTKNRSGQLGGAIYSGSSIDVNQANVFKGNFATDRALDLYRTDGGYSNANCSDVYLPNAVRGYWDMDGFHNGSQSFFVNYGC